MQTSLIVEERATDNAQDQTALALARFGVPELPESSFVCVSDPVDAEQEGALRWDCALCWGDQPS